MEKLCGLRKEKKERRRRRRQLAIASDEDGIEGWPRAPCGTAPRAVGSGTVRELEFHGAPIHIAECIFVCFMLLEHSNPLCGIEK